ncbi:hypothetical protein CLOBOL_03847 [Enterocloster bolteae ATCC BAA-613]|uniref:Uncharacterized protein n=1 Tax=Enterocloster bolteae (strain ATCC BAA-613 / DSM 15670 / CCUG 46953 / JCM 12243 / WAL 16351) TaxID=411902 RepID=A8RTZ8_ENTBW|nr:hypothetical protein CLOBOL_03847 [Enterocloster bolteae ATCC BAA-613]
MICRVHFANLLGQEKAGELQTVAWSYMQTQRRLKKQNGLTAVRQSFIIIFQECGTD